YTGVRVLAFVEVRALTNARPQIPLVLLAAPALDLVVWRLAISPAPRPAARPTGRSTRPIQAPAPRAPAPRGWWTGAGWRTAAGGAAFGAVLLLIEWPYTAAYAAVVWTPA